MSLPPALLGLTTRHTGAQLGNSAMAKHLRAGKAHALALIVGFLPTLAAAGHYVAHDDGAPGETVALEVQFAGDGVTAETQIDLLFDSNLLSAGVPTSNNDAICLRVSPSRIRIIPPSGGNSALPSALTTYCTFPMTIASGAAGLIPFTALGIECLSPLAQFQPCSLAAGAGINVPASPQPRTLAYTPTAGSVITFANGTVPGTQAPTRTIAVSVLGNTGSASLTSCALGGAGASSFSVTPSQLVFNDSIARSLSLGCTYLAVPATAQLTCTEIDADSPAPGETRSFTLNCPAAMPPPDVAPVLSATPASGATLQPFGSVLGNLATRTVAFASSGGSGAGSTTLICNATGAVRLAFSPDTPTDSGPIEQTIVGTASPRELRVGVVWQSIITPPIQAGTVTCTAVGQATFSYAVNTPTAFPPPISPPPPTLGGFAGPRLIPGLSPFGILCLISLVILAGVWANRQR